MFKVSAIIPAAGSGTRFGEEKQFKVLNGKPLWSYTLQPFVKSKFIDEIILVLPEEFILNVKSSYDYSLFSKKKDLKLVSGGSRRKDSVLNGLLSTKETNEIVCIHDVARPLIKQSLIEKSINGCKNYDGCILALPSTDSVKVVNEYVVQETIDRNKVWLAQTPQVFWKNKLLKAYNQNSSVLEITDESTIMEMAGFSVKVIDGNINNFKITNKLDWKIFKIIIEKQNL